MQVYSDAIKEIISCDSFEFDTEEVSFAFSDFEIPCKKFAAIRMFNDDYQHTIDIDCDANIDHHLSFKLDDIKSHMEPDP